MKKVAIITGAGSGIGRATAKAFMDGGYSVALIGRRLNALEETAALSGGGFPYACDLSDEMQVDSTFKEVAKEHGRIDVLFNNAGSNCKAGPIDEISVADWRSVIDINLTGSFLAARAAFAQMRYQDPQGGRIINNGSVSAYAPRPGSAPYTSSKHAISGLTRSIALDGRPFSIACGQIDIGNALTDMAVAMTKGVPQANGESAIEPVMAAEEVAEAVLNMANLPLSTNILFQTIMATNMPFVGRG